MADFERIEKEIDAAFAQSPLLGLGFQQAVWTLLSVAEEYHFKHEYLQPLDQFGIAMYTDTLLNALTHPLRVCLASQHSTDKDNREINRKLIDDDYSAAFDWMDRTFAKKH